MQNLQSATSQDPARRYGNAMKDAQQRDTQPISVNGGNLLYMYGNPTIRLQSPLQVPGFVVPNLFSESQHLASSLPSPYIVAAESSHHGR